MQIYVLYLYTIIYIYSPFVQYKNTRSMQIPDAVRFGLLVQAFTKFDGIPKMVGFVKGFPFPLGSVEVSC